ncbi:MAG: WG repeat-containing protein [Cellulosilyticaceae bacterium]
MGILKSDILEVGDRMRRRIRILLSIVMVVLIGLPVMGKEFGQLYPALLRTTQGNFYGYIDASGKWVAEPVYTYATDFSEGYGIVEKDGKYGILDTKGKEVLAPTYGSISPFKEGRAVFVEGDKMGVLDTKGRPISDKRYSFIQDYAEGMAVVGKYEDGKSLYGYMDLNGNEVIPIQYEEASDFQDGKALVKLSDSTYGLIDKRGEVQQVLAYDRLYGRSEGRIIYQDKDTGKVGYIDESGQVVIPAAYQNADSFQSGLAVVGTSPYFWGEEGVIGLDGESIYPTIYNNVLNLGEGRVALGQALDAKEPLKGSLYALADEGGQALTDFIYYGIAPYHEGQSSAYDEANVYMIDKEGNKMRNFPDIPGAGTLTKDGTIIRADVDYYTFYLGSKGDIIYAPNTIIPLDEAVQVWNEGYRPNVNYLVYYPRLVGLSDLSVQQKMNEHFMREMMHEDVTAKEVLEYTYYSNYTIPFYKDQLLVVDSISSTYYFGAAHPQPARKTMVGNLGTGEFYQLQDLFMKESEWQRILTEIINQMAKEEPIASQLYNPTEKVVLEDEQGFYVDEDNLYIYYPPYDIGPYASGYITFKVPFSELMEVIDTEGSFWKAFHTP